MALNNYHASPGGYLLGIDEAAPTVGIKATASDPRVATLDLPTGSLALYVNGASSRLLQKLGTGTNDWADVGAPTEQETVTSGALKVGVRTSFVSVTGTVAYTLAAGEFPGQRKRIECTVAATTPIGTLTLADADGTEPTAWIFNTVGQALELEWRAGGWKVLDYTAVGSDTPAGASTLNLLVLTHRVTVADTIDWIIPSGVIAGKLQMIDVAAVSGTPSGTISGLFYDDDGTADGTDVNINAAGDKVLCMWDGARWHGLNLVSATVS